MNIVVIGLSHHSSPVELRERFAFAEANIPDALRSLRESGIAREAVILSTCNRVEIYAATALEPAKAFAELKTFLARCGETPGEPSVDRNSGSRGFSPHQTDIHAQCSSPSPQRGEGRGEETVLPDSNPLAPTLSPLGRGEGVQLSSDELYSFAEPQSLHHLFKVACGLDSMVLGETEILGQLKQAYALAHRHGHTGARLNKAFQRAFNVAKHIRTETNIQRGSVSVASVAVELAEKIFSSLNDREVMVIGAGETSEKTARALLSRGARSIIVANRSHDRAVALAKELGGRAVQFDDWAAEFGKIDIVISSTAAPHHILDRARLEPLMKSRRHRPLLLIDIAVPRDIDPEVNFLENVYLYNIDDLQAIADDYLRLRKEEMATCEAIIAEKVKKLLESETIQPRRDTEGHGQDMKTIYPKPGSPFGKLASFLFLILCLTLMSMEAFAADLTNEWAKAIWAYRQGNFQIALFHYNEILKLDSNNVAALLGKAGACQNLKQFSEAENTCNEAIRLSSNNISLGAAFFYRGYVHEQMTNLNQAIDDFSRAAQYNPSYGDAYAYRANASFLSGMYDAAMQDCNMAIMLKPDSPDAYDTRGCLLYRISNYDRSIADFSKAIELSSNSAALSKLYFSRAVAYADKEDYSRAVADLTTVSELDPENTTRNAEVYSNRGFCRSKMGEYDKGIEDCKRGFQLNTNSPSALNNLAWLLATAPDAKLRDGNKAVEYAKCACELTQWKNPYFMGTLAVAYAEAGNFDEAVKWEKKCISSGLPEKEIAQAHEELDLFEQKKPYHAEK